MPRPSSNQSFQGRLNVAFINIRYIIFQQQHIPVSGNTWFLALFVPVILDFLELKYQGTAFSSFQTHPKTMRFAVVALLLYCFAYDFETRLRSPAYAHVFRGGKAVFGLLLSVSLASVLFQDFVWIALFFLFTLLSNRETLNSTFKVMYDWLQMRMNRGNRRNLLPL
ncbi:hypothetical protein Acr_00g0028770 [Actinidia rufa]|uniref:Uncharacterized protein n=1 Tax=Actinidia rufa TaxID=165716 RepID=A0A7J0DEY2_9ERIC|nr:hypothetical protein Acr_00g0028770 [Actinidia rufa]